MEKESLKIKIKKPIYGFSIHTMPTYSVFGFSYANINDTRKKTLNGDDAQKKNPPIFKQQLERMDGKTIKLSNNKV